MTAMVDNKMLVLPHPVSHASVSMGDLFQDHSQMLESTGALSLYIMAQYLHINHSRHCIHFKSSLDCDHYGNISCVVFFRE